MSAAEDRPITLDEARDEIHRVVYSTARQFAGKHFGSHTSDDVVQTCVLLGLEVLAEGKYDPSRDLGPFLFVHMRNKLSNQMRSQMSRRESSCSCCSVDSPPAEPCGLFYKYLQANDFRKSLAKVKAPQDRAARLETPEQVAMARELDQYIRERLDPKLVVHYEQMLVDDPPQGGRLRQVRNAIRVILEDSPYAEMVPPAKPVKVRPTITLSWQGQTKSLVAWSEITGVNVTTLYWRRHKGWPVERILGSPACTTRTRPGLPAPKTRHIAN
jgi:DNA-directed RNA polymerase specialized sigma24 family protein